MVFIGALRVNNSLDPWEIECISCEALSLFIVEQIYYFALIGLLGWFSRMSWLFGSLHVICYPFFIHSLRFIEKYVTIVVSVCFSLMSLNLSLALFFFYFAQECKRLSVRGFDVSSFFIFLNPFCLYFNYWLLDQVALE